MDSDLAWVNGKSGRQSWCYADAFKRSIKSGSHLPFTIYPKLRFAAHWNRQLVIVHISWITICMYVWKGGYLWAGLHGSSCWIWILSVE